MESKGRLRSYTVFKEVEGAGHLNSTECPELGATWRMLWKHLANVNMGSMLGDSTVSLLSFLN